MCNIHLVHNGISSLCVPCCILIAITFVIDKSMMAIINFWAITFILVKVMGHNKKTYKEKEFCCMNNKKNTPPDYFLRIYKTKKNKNICLNKFLNDFGTYCFKCTSIDCRQFYTNAEITLNLEWNYWKFSAWFSKKKTKLNCQIDKIKFNKFLKTVSCSLQMWWVHFQYKITNHKLNSSSINTWKVHWTRNCF